MNNDLQLAGVHWKNRWLKNMEKKSRENEESIMKSENDFLVKTNKLTTKDILSGTGEEKELGVKWMRETSEDNE